MKKATARSESRPPIDTVVCRKLPPPHNLFSLNA